MVKYTIHISLIFLLVSCSNTVSDKESDILKNQIETKGTDITWEQLDSLYSLKYERILDAIDEPVIKEREVESYTFIYQPSFGQNYELFRFEKDNDSFYLHQKIFQYSSDGGIEATIIDNNRIGKSLQEWDSLKLLVNGSYFWSLHTKEMSPISYDGFSYGFIGRRIIVKNSSEELDYHIVHRQNPHEGSFKELCEYLKTIAKEGKNTP